MSCRRCHFLLFFCSPHSCGDHCCVARIRLHEVGHARKVEAPSSAEARGTPSNESSPSSQTSCANPACSRLPPRKRSSLSLLLSSTIRPAPRTDDLSRRHLGREHTGRATPGCCWAIGWYTAHARPRIHVNATTVSALYPGPTDGPDGLRRATDARSPVRARGFSHLPRVIDLLDRPLSDACCGAECVCQENQDGFVTPGPTPRVVTSLLNTVSLGGGSSRGLGWRKLNNLIVQ